MKPFGKLITLFFVIGLVLSVSKAHAQTGRGLHKKIYAVPRTKPVTIDGNLADWDLSGQIRSYVVAETAETQSSTIAVMYDDEALYISAVVRDSLRQLQGDAQPRRLPDSG